jgi:hypothetical protein
MPRGAKPGERRGGGRKKGQPNRATIEKAALAERILAEQAGRPGQKLGREVLEEFMNMFGGIAGAFQPTPATPGGPISPDDLQRWAASKDEPMFEKYAKLALKAATELADFQSPKFAPVHVAAPAPEARGPLKRKFTISIFDGQGRPAPRHITVKPNSSVTTTAKN